MPFKWSEAEKTVELMTDDGKLNLLKVSGSPAPVVLVKKNGGSTRFCVE